MFSNTNNTDHWILHRETARAFLHTCKATRSFLGSLVKTPEEQEEGACVRASGGREAPCLLCWRSATLSFKASPASCCSLSRGSQANRSAVLSSSAEAARAPAAVRGGEAAAFCSLLLLRLLLRVPRLLSVGANRRRAGQSARGPSARQGSMRRGCWAPAGAGEGGERRCRRRSRPEGGRGQSACRAAAAV